jgi:hypothetical protein
VKVSKAIRERQENKVKEKKKKRKKSIWKGKTRRQVKRTPEASEASELKGPRLCMG